MLEGVEVRTGVEYKDLIAEQPDIADRVIYCGPIDCVLRLTAWVSLSIAACASRPRFADEADHQGVAVVNYNEREVPYTRVIEHKHFEFGTQPQDALSRASTPPTGSRATSRTTRSTTSATPRCTSSTSELADREGKVVFAGRLGGYKYYDMDKAIAAAFEVVKSELGVDPAAGL